MAELFGFSITRLKKQADPKQSFTTAQADDGTQTVSAGGHFGSYLDMEGTAKTEQDLIRRYREIAIHPECDMAIEDIVNEAIVANELKDAVRVMFNNLPYGREIQRKMSLLGCKKCRYVAIQKSLLKLPSVPSKHLFTSF